MTYNIKDLKGKEGGATLESSDRDATPAGLYRHPVSGKEMITMFDPLYGNVQSEGVVRLGFEYVGPAPKGSVKTIVEQNRNSRIYGQDTVVSDKARLDSLELESLRREKVEREKVEEADKAAPTPAPAPEVKEAPKPAPVPADEKTK
jgi:hypothetical protein